MQGCFAAQLIRRVSGAAENSHMMGMERDFGTRRAVWDYGFVCLISMGNAYISQRNPAWVPGLAAIPHRI